jgi:hypothetical protein
MVAELVPYSIAADSLTSPFCSGGITSNDWNTRILIIALCVGLVASVKRLWMGFLLGKKAFGKKMPCSFYSFLGCSVTCNI